MAPSCSSNTVLASAGAEASLSVSILAQASRSGIRTQAAVSAVCASALSVSLRAAITPLTSTGICSSDTVSPNARKAAALERRVRAGGQFQQLRHGGIDSSPANQLQRQDLIRGLGAVQFGDDGLVRLVARQGSQRFFRRLGQRRIRAGGNFPQRGNHPGITDLLQTVESRHTHFGRFRRRARPPQPEWPAHRPGHRSPGSRLPHSRRQITEAADQCRHDLCRLEFARRAQCHIDRRRARRTATVRPATRCHLFREREWLPAGRPGG